jgi:exonuclease SbcC
MRPLRLRAKGLRSYRAEFEIDFSDAGLFAIIGDTGAGKSSILEAMTYALYSATTWTQRDVGSLISDGANTMSVTLDFSVDGQVYRVTRATSRGAYPPPVHKFECLSDPSLRRDGESAVTAEIERLVGLRYKGFLSAVILPQGRFDTLLRATPADRTFILKSILRLDELEAVREHVRALVDRLAPTVADLELRRRLLLDDPVSAREAAQLELAAAKAEGARLQSLRSELDELRRRRLELADLAERREADRTSVSDALAACDGALYERIVALDASLASEIAAATKAEAQAAKALATAADLVAEAETAGEGLVDLTSHAKALEGLSREMPLVAIATDALATEGVKLAADEQAIVASEARLAELKADAEHAAAALDIAEAAESGAVAARNGAASILEAFRRCEADMVAAAAKRDERSAELEPAAAELSECERDAAAARSASDVALELLEEVRHRRAAAHAAAGVGPGDPCPVCARRLPASFMPPVAEDLADAEQQAKGMADAAQAANKRADEARTSVATLGEGLRLAELEVVSARERLAAARQEAIEALPGFAPEKANDASLASLDDTLASAKAARADARTAADAARAAANTLDGEVRAARKALIEWQEQYEAQLQAHAQREAAIAAQIAALPAHLRPGEEPGRDHDTLRASLQANIAAARERADALEMARATWDTARTRLATVQQRRRDEVDRPRERLRTAHSVLRAALQRAGTDGTATEPLSGDDLSSEAEWAASLREAAEAAVSQLGNAVSVAAAESDDCVAATNHLLAEAGLDDDAALEEATRRAAGDERVAREAVARAEREIPLAAEVDALLSEGTAFLSTLRELAALLTDGTFIGHVVAQRQRALLGVSSEILGSVSGGRYGFAEDFQIVDRQTGQARSSRTLSGGETFQASLSLALGLVELAGRSGGRLDALFLDEGFGALDANALNEALTELERRASGGRLVGVVSHIRAVAEGIEQVLLVTRGPAGSAARWISHAEREAEVEREIGDGLLA